MRTRSLLVGVEFIFSVLSKLYGECFCVSAADSCRGQFEGFKSEMLSFLCGLLVQHLVRKAVIIHKSQSTQTLSLQHLSFFSSFPTALPLQISSQRNSTGAWHALKKV